MESLSYFRKLFDYDYWGNQESLSALLSMNPVPESPLTIFGHVIGAQRIWFYRIEQDGRNAPDVWPPLRLEECQAAVEVLHKRWVTLLSKLTPGQLNENVSYRNSKGAEFKTPLEDVLQHVVMHSAYHRGQVAAAIRQAGGQPSLTDYVVYVRRNPQAS